MSVPRSLLVLPSTLYVASGASQMLPVATVNSVDIDINVSAIAGAGAQVVFSYQRLGEDGNYYTIWQSAAVNAVGQVSISIGPGLEVDKDTGLEGQLNWTISGAGAQVTFSASIQGK